MERYVYLPYGTGNLAKPLTAFLPPEPPAVEPAPAKTTDAKPEPVEIADADLPLATAPTQDAIDVDAITGVKDLDFDQIVADLGLK